MLIESMSILYILYTVLFMQLAKTNTYNLILILFLYVCEAINLVVLSPMIPFLLLKYGMISNLNDASLYSGYFSGVYYLGQFICNYPFSILYEKNKKKLCFSELLQQSYSIYFL